MRLGATPAEQLGHALVFLLLGIGLGLPPLFAAGSAWGHDRHRRRLRRAGRDTALADGRGEIADEVEFVAAARTMPPRAANL